MPPAGGGKGVVVEGHEEQLDAAVEVRARVPAEELHKVGAHRVAAASGDVLRGAEGEALVQVVGPGALLEDGEEELEAE